MATETVAHAHYGLRQLARKGVGEVQHVARQVCPRRLVAQNGLVEHARRTLVGGIHCPDGPQSHSPRLLLQLLLQVVEEGLI